MTGRIAVVTGSNSGVGMELSILLAETYKVYATMRSTGKKGDLMDKAAKAGVDKNIVVLEMDVSSDSSVTGAFEKIKAAADENSETVDVLVNNAGYSVFGSIEMLAMEAVKAQFETNFFGVVRCQQAVLPIMRAQRSGLIVNISSIGGIWGQPFNDVYCASKFAVEGMTQSQAALFAQFGVKVCTVQPGGIKTSFVQNAARPDMTKVPKEYIQPMQQVIAAYQKGEATQTPLEVAQVVMEQAVRNKTPPLFIQTNPKIQGVFKAQLTDPTGGNTIDLANEKFFNSK